MNVEILNEASKKMSEYIHQQVEERVNEWIKYAWGTDAKTEINRLLREKEELKAELERIKHVNEIECETGCHIFTGGEIRHHEDCFFYPDSLTAMSDRLRSENQVLRDGLTIYANGSGLKLKPEKENLYREGVKYGDRDWLARSMSDWDSKLISKEALTRADEIREREGNGTINALSPDRGIKHE